MKKARKVGLGAFALILVAAVANAQGGEKGSSAATGPQNTRASASALGQRPLVLSGQFPWME